MVFSGIWSWSVFGVPHRQPYVKRLMAGDILDPVGDKPINRGLIMENEDGTVKFCGNDRIKPNQTDPSVRREASIARHEAAASSDSIETAIHAEVTTRRKE